MQTHLIRVTVVISLLIFTGCSTQATLTVLSQPEGAYISEITTGRPFGITPLVVNYNPRELEKHMDVQGCYLVNGLKAQWVSGAVTVINPIKLCGYSFGDFNITMGRDQQQPGLEKDLQFALQLQAVKAQQAQAEAANNAAEAALWSAWSASQGRSVICTSTSAGTSTNMSCH